MRPLLAKTLVIACSMVLSSCASLQIPDLTGILPGEAPLTEQKVARGLKEALTIGTQRTSATLSATGGFSSNSLLRIALPEEFNTVASRLRSIGLGGEVDSFELKMNQAAEKAAGEAFDVFSTAIVNMSLTDAFSILNGPQNAATTYFKKETSTELANRFEPVVKSAMEQVGVYTVYSQLVESYNAIPLVRPVTVDLEAYIVQRTLSGMFSVLESEELKIREDPLARTTELLKSVFGSRKS